MMPLLFSPSIRGVLALLAVATAEHLVRSTTSAEENDESPAQLVAKLRELSAAQLETRVDSALKDKRLWRNVELEACLTEIVRRGDDGAKAVLQRHLSELMTRRAKRNESDDDVDSAGSFPLELLTALRRVEKKPDPLTILIETKESTLKATPLELPRLKVTIKNVDAENAAVGFAFGGDYRVEKVEKGGKGVRLNYWGGGWHGR